MATSKNKEHAFDEVFNEKNRKEWIKNIDEKKRKPKKRLFIGLVIAGGFLFSVLLFKDNIVTALVNADIPGVSDKLQPLLPVEAEQPTYEEVSEKLALSERELAIALGGIQALEQQREELRTQIEGLTPYKTQVDEFIKHKDAWDTTIAMKNPELFITHYETMNPDVSKEVYVVLKANAIQSEEEKKYIKTINGLDNKKAAALVETLLETDTSLVLNILDNLSVDKNTGILSSLKPEIAAKVSELRNPFKEE